MATPTANAMLQPMEQYLIRHITIFIIRKPVYIARGA